LALTLADIKARPRQEVTFTVECSGNTGLPFFNGGIGNARWAGTPLAPILEEAGVLDSGIEVVFWAADEGEIKKADDVTFKQNFARSMSLADAMDAKNILCYEMNGTLATIVFRTVSRSSVELTALLTSPSASNSPTSRASSAVRA
jgi:DMSO/TMAO reductase YedYZ molybdopterin-dependent catalytic subunit